MRRASPKVGSLKGRNIGEDDLLAARLLATFPTDRTAWDDDAAFRIANLDRRELFFCPAAKPLGHRAGAIAAISKKLDVAVAREDLKSLSSGEPLSLRTILHIQRALLAIAQSKDEKVRDVTAVKASRGGAQARPLVLG